MTRLVPGLAACSAALLLPACGIGTVGAASASGGDSGNAAPSIAAFQVEGPKESPATVRFVLSDQEGDPATVEFLYSVGGAGLLPLTQLAGVPGNPATLATSPGGTSYVLSWDFASEALLPDDASFVRDVTVFASLQGGTGLVPGANGAQLGMGNDPPATSPFPPDPQVEGIAAFRFQVSDSSGDVVSVKVQYLVDGAPTANPPLARPAGLPAGAPTPEFAFPAVVTPEAGDAVELVFFWDTDFDLVDLDRRVRLRFTPNDGVVDGTPAETLLFLVDNNGVPEAVLDAGLIAVSSDGRRRIPLPFEVADDEGDEIEMVVQWRRPGQGFPSLPAEPAEIRAILASPELRAAHRIATEWPVASGGRVQAAGASTVLLPELGGSAAGLLAEGIVGRELELLRSSSVPTPVASSWATNPLRTPVAALPVDGGLAALVLDRPSAGAWRLSRVVLANGAHVPVAESAGDPGAMAFEPGASSVLVASDTSGLWRIERVDLPSGAVTPLVTAADGATELGNVRGLASLGREAALLTVSTSLVAVSYPEGGPPRAASLITGLHTPWGVVRDPLAPERVYLAERDAPVAGGSGRIVAVDLNALAVRPVVSADGPAFPRPRSLALERGGGRLVAVTDAVPGDGRIELRAVDLGSPEANAVFEVATLVTGGARSLATGPDGLRLLALGGPGDLAVGGGRIQRRTVVAHEPGELTVTVDRPFDPVPSPLTPWRVTRSVSSLRPGPEGTRQSFVWDSGDLVGGGEVLFRLVPFDDDVGAVSTSQSAKVVSQAFGPAEAGLRLGGEGRTDGPVAGAAADLDGDGDLDLVSANQPGDDLTLFFQERPGVFDPAPSATLGGPTTTNGPKSVAAGDLDGDGDVDLVSANRQSHDLALFLQEGGGVFDPVPSARLGGVATTGGASDVALADLDGDGSLDLVSANQVADRLTLFFQNAPGAFDPAPSAVLGDASVTDGAISVAAADLDRDGDLDLACANREGHDLAVFLQQGAGVFDPVPTSLGTFETTNAAVSVTVADLDGDGDLDLASANHGPLLLQGDTETPLEGSNLTVFWQTGPGTFDPLPLVLGGVSVTYDPTSVSAVDLDGDGDLDLATTIQALDMGATFNNLAFFYQVGPGAFDPVPRTLGDADSTGSPAALVCADLDGDGRTDLVSCNSGMNSFSPPGAGDDLTVFFQSRPGVVGATPVPFRPPTTVIDLEVGDLDGDGDLDVVAPDGIALTTLSLFTQRGPGAFDPGVVLGPVGQPLSTAVADLDGDGDLDVAVTAHDTDPGTTELESGVILHYQRRPGLFDGSAAPLPTPSPPAAPSAEPLALQAADLDGDGDVDLFLAERLNGKLALFLQNGPVYHQDPDAARSRLVSDRAFERRTLSFPTWFEGRLTNPNNPNTLLAFGANSAVAADLDGDGDLDLASENGARTPFSLPNPRRGDVTLFFQTEPGEFEAAPDPIGFSTTRTGGEIEAADLDADGDLDLVTANGIGNDLTVFRQSGPGVFEEAAVHRLQGIVRPLSVEVADMDVDGDLDLVSANSGAPFGGSVTLFRQLHPGAFATRPDVILQAELDMPLVVKVADLDGDGEPDLLLGDSFTGITVFYGGHE